MNRSLSSTIYSFFHNFFFFESGFGWWVLEKIQTATLKAFPTLFYTSTQRELIEGSAA